MDETTLVTKGLWEKWWGLVDNNGIEDFSVASNGASGYDCDVSILR
jgi:hypothetical protein